MLNRFPRDSDDDLDLETVGASCFSFSSSACKLFLSEKPVEQQTCSASENYSLQMHGGIIVIGRRILGLRRRTHGGRPLNKSLSYCFKLFIYRITYNLLTDKLEEEAESLC